MLIEVATDSAANAAAAADAGADRIELCSRLDLDGLTPDADLIRRTRQGTAAPVLVMLRHRDGPFTCSPAEQPIVLRQLDELLDPAAGGAGGAGGVAGVVFGYLDGRGMIDEPLCRTLLARCQGVERVFHRAFDRTPDPLAALDTLIALGFTRVLTSGHASSAATPEGMEGLQRLVLHAKGRIEILPGGGVRSANAAELIRRTGCTQVHSSGRVNGGFDRDEVVRLRHAVDHA